VRPLTTLSFFFESREIYFSIYGKDLDFNLMVNNSSFSSSFSVGHECDSCETIGVLYYCNTCDAALCEGCKVLHFSVKIHRKHVIVPYVTHPRPPALLQEHSAVDVDAEDSGGNGAIGLNAAESGGNGGVRLSAADSGGS
jgi:hypothetical protein